MNAKEHTPNEKTTTPGTPQASSKPTPDKKEGSEKWKNFSEDKQKKLYENTLFPHIKYVLDKFKHKLPKDDLKRHAKDVAKKLVNSDFKNNRVEDPTNINEKQQKKVKKYCKEYFDKAVMKQRVHEKKKAGKQDKGANGSKPEDDDDDDNDNDAANGESEDEGVDVKMSDDEGDGDENNNNNSNNTKDVSVSLKRKRPDHENGDEKNGARSLSPSKRQRSSTPPPPPPPPISPGEGMQIGNGNENEDADIDVDADSTPAATATAMQSQSQSQSPPPPPPPPPLSVEQ